MLREKRSRTSPAEGNSSHAATIRFTLRLYLARYQNGGERQHQSLSNFGFVTRYWCRSNVDNFNVHTLLLYLCSAKPANPAYLSHRLPVWLAFNLGTGYGLSWAEEKV